MKQIHIFQFFQFIFVVGVIGFAAYYFRYEPIPSASIADGKVFLLDRLMGRLCVYQDFGAQGNFPEFACTIDEFLDAQMAFVENRLELDRAEETKFNKMDEVTRDVEADLSEGVSEGLVALNSLRESGFSDEDVASWKVRKTSSARDAGYSQADIDTFWGDESE